jgi:predicted nuclease of predicted toxin-antitoxin system
VKFLIDMPLSPDLAAWLRDQGHDAVHAAELGLDRSPDNEIVTFARQNSRTIVSADLDYPRLLAIAGSSSPGLILFRDGNWGDAEIKSRMDDVLCSLSPADISESIVVVERRRVRRRRLPIS